MPKISVIIPTWNSANTLKQCLDSVFRQSFQNFEVIVVDDGSTDDTSRVLEPYHSRLRVIQQENRGSNVARNRGWREAKGEFLIFLDSDMTLGDDCFEKLVKALEDHPEVSYVYAPIRYGNKLFRLWSFSADRLRKMPYIHTSSLVRAKDFPGFDENVKRLQDWDVWLTMLEQGKVGMRVSETILDVKPRPDGISQWVPRWFFWIPWFLIGWKPDRVRKYQEAVKIIKEKHGI